MNIALWAVQVLLGLAFFMAGGMKLTSPIPELAELGGWAVDFPALLIRFIGLSEVLGGLGLVLPAATKIQPQLTPWAAGGLTTVMVLAAIVHAAYGEYGAVVPNLVLGSLAAFVAVGRTRVASVQASRA
jgi:putative oxidoreductase